MVQRLRIFLKELFCLHLNLEVDLHSPDPWGNVPTRCKRCGKYIGEVPPGGPFA